MSKEVIITDEIRLVVAREQLEKTYKNVKLAAGATVTMVAIKGGLVVVPKALTFLKGSVVFMGCLPIPNYFSILAGGLLAVDVVLGVKAQKDKIAEEKAKNKTFKESELFQLEVEEND